MPYWIQAKVKDGAFSVVVESPRVGGLAAILVDNEGGAGRIGRVGGAVSRQAGDDGRFW
jgi:hypothetical protein